MKSVKQKPSAKKKTRKKTVAKVSSANKVKRGGIIPFYEFSVMDPAYMPFIEVTRIRLSVFKTGWVRMSADWQCINKDDSVGGAYKWLDREIVHTTPDDFTNEVSVTLNFGSYVSKKSNSSAKNITFGLDCSELLVEAGEPIQLQYSHISTEKYRVHVYFKPTDREPYGKIEVEEIYE